MRISSSMFHSNFDKPSFIEQIVLQHYRGLTWVVAADVLFEGEELADAVAESTSHFLERTLFDCLKLGRGGGAHMWDVLRRLEPRNLGMDIWAPGYGHVDAQTPHLHPNALATFLSILYAPRSKPHLVALCSMFYAASAYARVLGNEMTNFLVEKHVMGDFLGVFFTPEGELLEPYAPSMTVSHVPSTDLRELAKRDDTIVLLSASGRHKAKLIRGVIEAGLCNALITDLETACAVVGLEKPRDSDDIVESRP